MFISLFRSIINYDTFHISTPAKITSYISNSSFPVWPISKADEIILRAYLEANEDKPSISVVPYADIYATVSYKNGAEGVVSKRARRGELTTLPTPFTKEEKATDQETHIFSASQLRSVGDLSPFKPGLLQVGKAIRLQVWKALFYTIRIR